MKTLQTQVLLKQKRTTSGPKVVGKIELPVEKSKSSDDGKRKRLELKSDVKSRLTQEKQGIKRQERRIRRRK